MGASRCEACWSIAIRSTGGIALLIGGSSFPYNAPVNSGLIDGAVAGVEVSNGIFVNTGTIRSAGIGVALGFSGTIDNRAGGIISGSTMAIGPGSGGIDINVQDVVENAGTIDGDVNLSSNYGGSNSYFALSGGVLNGNLSLGNGGVLVVELANGGPGQFGGITGTVTAANSKLYYQVRGDGSASYAPIAGFSSIGYQLFDNAALTLAGAGTTMNTLTLAGTGSVDVTADIATVDQTAIQSISLFVPGGHTGTPNALAVTSRGNLSVTDHSYGGVVAVALGGSDSFTNAGTISASEQGNSTYVAPIAAIGGGTVVNSGTINLDGAIGVRGATSLTNSGGILQAVGGGASIGVQDIATLTNSGTIDVGGVAVTQSTSNYQRSSIVNAATGTIAGDGGTAIQLAGGNLVNAGTVTGTVDLGYTTNYDGTPARSYASGSYVTAGGTIAGDLRFGTGDDFFLQTGATTGVSGVIDGGSGNNLFGLSFTTNGTTAVDAAVPALNFNLGLVQVLGADTTVTLTGTTATDFYAVGDGSIVNEAKIGGNLSFQTPAQATAALGTANTTLAAFTNTATIGGGVFGLVTRFINTGNIGTETQDQPAVSIANAGPIAFVNSGQLLSGTSQYDYYGSGVTASVSGSDAVSFDNSGTISNGAAVSGSFESADAAGAVSVANTGNIGDGGLGSGLLVEAYANTDNSGGTVTITNSGTIAGGDPQNYFSSPTGLGLSLGGYDAALTYAITNSGTITDVASPEALGYASGVLIGGEGAPTSGTVTNTATDMIAATGVVAAGVTNDGTVFTLDNAGSIAATGTRTAYSTGTAVGVESFDNAETVVRNSGSITATGDDAVGVYVFGGPLAIDNAGVIAANGTTSSIAIESVSDAEDGVVAPANIIRNTGTITGAIMLVEGADTVENSGTIIGDVMLGGGDDTFVQDGGGNVSGLIDGGDGTDLYRVVLAGNRSGIGARTNFEQLAIDGSGTLSLTLDQNFQSIALNGTNLSLSRADS